MCIMVNMNDGFFRHSNSSEYDILLNVKHHTKPVSIITVSILFHNATVLVHKDKDMVRH